MSVSSGSCMPLWLHHNMTDAGQEVLIQTLLAWWISHSNDLLRYDIPTRRGEVVCAFL